MMKRITVLLLTISTILCLTSGSSRAQQSQANSLRLPTEKNTLIVYLSRTNNTKAIAEMIHQRIGGTLSLSNWKRLIPLTTGQPCNRSSARMRPVICLL